MSQWLGLCLTMAPEFYLFVKAAHVGAVILFVGGLFASGVSTAVLPLLGERASVAAIAVRRWDQWCTTPALIATWALGLWLAMEGNWFGHVWLQVKLAAVVVLTILRSVQSGRLLRIAKGDNPAPQHSTVVIVICVLVIAGLAVVKPG